MAITLYDNDSGTRLGEIAESDLEFLIDNLEEETSDDQDYYLRREALVMLQERGASDRLMGILRSSLGERPGLEIRWQREA